MAILDRRGGAGDLGLSNLLATRQPGVELDAEEILKQRYARGEIRREELVQAREALR